jgi:hypothetical protein
MKRRRLFELLRLPVSTGGIRLGRSVDALVDGERRLVGLEVVGGDGRHRFLPLGAADVGDEEVAVASALVFLEERALAYYREHTQSARALGLRDAWVEEDGTLSEALSAA